MYPIIAAATPALEGTSLVVPIIAIAIVIAFVALAMVVASRYKRVAPNVIGVFYGRKHKIKGADGVFAERGYRTVTGGGSILWPILEKYQEMSMAAFQVEVRETNIPSAKNVGVDIGGMATCRISQTPEDQNNAVSAFLGKTQAEIKEFVEQILKGHIRSIIGKLLVEEILRDRATFNQKVVEESAEEFRKLGLQIVTLVIQDVKDSHGYIDALGKQEIAAKLRDADIQIAEAKRDTAIRVSNAERDAATVSAQNAAKVAEANRDRDVQIAENLRLVAGKKAEADAAGPLAKAAQDQKIKVAEAERDRADAEAQITVQEKERLRKQAELQATVIVTAEADRTALLIKADGAQKAADFEAKRAAIQAEGQRNATVTTGEGEAKKTTLLANATAEATRATMGAQAEGNQKVQLAAAEGTRANLLATAEGEKAKLLAVAEGERMRLGAIAEGKEKSLLAEAHGTGELAEAMKKLDEQGRFLLILDRMPPLFDKGGEALAKVVAEIFGPMGTALGRIDKITITDLGGGNTAKDSLANLASVIPNTVAQFVANCQARGIDVTPMLALLKMDGSGLQKLIGANVSLNPEKLLATASSAVVPVTDAPPAGGGSKK